MIKHETLGKISKKLSKFLQDNDVKFRKAVKRYYSHLEPGKCRGTYVDWYFKVNDGEWVNAHMKADLKRELTKLVKTKETKMEWLVAIRLERDYEQFKTEVFKFPTKKSADEFTKELEEEHPGIDYIRTVEAK